MDAPGWEKLYESAVLETNNEVLAQRIAAALTALKARLHELNMDHGGTPEEQQALQQALAALGSLSRERLGQ
jgi:hypothetical protein